MAGGGMARNVDHDVVIVGASIAGCTAAVLFARAGLKVALVERKRDLNAYKHLCTHYLQSSATPTLSRLGLTGQLQAAGAGSSPGAWCLAVGA